MFQPMQPWRHATFLRLIIPLIAGITCAWYLPLDISAGPAAVCSTLAGLILLFIFLNNIRALSPLLVTSILYILLFITGGLLTIFHDMGRRADFAGRQFNDSGLVVLRLREPPVEKPASWKAEADIIRVGNEDTFHRTSGRAILYFQKRDSVLPLHYGDVIISKNNLQPILNSGNPGAFDYKRYCHLQNIFYQGYLTAGSWEKLPFTKREPLKVFFLTCRSWCLKTLSTFITGARELGVAEALLVGYRDNLDKELVQAYANVGVVHIIAISGLHLGLIYLILLFIFKPIPDKGVGRWIKGTLVILSLWCFALITGAAPSALRAALMFSFFAVARFFIQRDGNKYNTLAASAFLLLCYNPFLLFHVGFQLSYLAVLGIIIFQKPIFNLMVSKNKYLNYLWEMASVSLAAELLIFPIAIYYFHQFPVLFLAVNLFIIPLASFILYGEIILLIVAFFNPVGAFVGEVLNKAIAIMNSIIEGVNQISFSSWSGLSLNTTDILFLYAFIIMMAIWFFYKKKQVCFGALLFLLCFSINRMAATVRLASQKEVIVYNVSHHRAIDFVAGKSARFVGDSGVTKDASILKYDIIPSRVSLQTQVNDTLAHFEKVDHFIQFYHIKMALLDSTFFSPPVGIPMHVDYVLVSHNPYLDLNQIKYSFSPRMIIFDASNAWWKIEKWKTACKQLNLHCFSVPDEGAWTLNLSHKRL